MQTTFKIKLNSKKRYCEKKKAKIMHTTANVNHSLTYIGVFNTLSMSKVNLITGYLQVNYFLASQTDDHKNQLMTVQEVAMGFIKVANETMCRPIRALTQVCNNQSDDVLKVRKSQWQYRRLSWDKECHWMKPYFRQCIETKSKQYQNVLIWHHSKQTGFV